MNQESPKYDKAEVESLKHTKRETQAKPPRYAKTRVAPPNILKGSINKATKIYKGKSRIVKHTKKESKQSHLSPKHTKGEAQAKSLGYVMAKVASPSILKGSANKATWICKGKSRSQSY